MKNFWGFTFKGGGGSRKTNREGRGCLKRGAWTVCWFKVGDWQELGGGVLRGGGVENLMHTMCMPHWLQTLNKDNVVINKVGCRVAK